MIRPTGVPPSTRTSLGAPPTPRFGVSEAKLQTPGANASRKRDGLFDMVKWNDGERFSDEPQLATRSPVLILRSARAPTARRSRMGVRASRRMRTATVCALMLRDASQRSRVWGRMRVRLGCDAPQHEGEQRRFGQTKPRSVAGKRTNLRLWETIAGSVPLFPDCYLQWMAQLQRVERQAVLRRASSGGVA
jgi:hypothetical protein